MTTWFSITLNQVHFGGERSVALKWYVSGKLNFSYNEISIFTCFMYWDDCVILAGHWDIFMGVYRNLFSTSGLQIPPWEQELLGKAKQFIYYITVCATHWVKRIIVKIWRLTVHSVQFKTFFFYFYSEPCWIFSEFR